MGTRCCERSVCHTKLLHCACFIVIPTIPSFELYLLTMKVIALLLTFLAVASAFAPSSVNSRSSTELGALFDDVSVVLWRAKTKLSSSGLASHPNCLPFCTPDRQHGSFCPQEGPEQVRRPPIKEREFNSELLCSFLAGAFSHVRLCVCYFYTDSSRPVPSVLEDTSQMVSLLLSTTPFVARKLPRRKLTTNETSQRRVSSLISLSSTWSVEPLRVEAGWSLPAADMNLSRPSMTGLERRTTPSHSSKCTNNILRYKRMRGDAWGILV